MAVCCRLPELWLALTDNEYSTNVCACAGVISFHFRSNGPTSWWTLWLCLTTAELQWLRTWTRRPWWVVAILSKFILHASRHGMVTFQKQQVVATCHVARGEGLLPLPSSSMRDGAALVQQHSRETSRESLWVVRCVQCALLRMRFPVLSSSADDRVQL